MDTRNTKNSEIAESVMPREAITPRRNAYPMHETPLSQNANSFWHMSSKTSVLAVCVSAALLAAVGIIYTNK